MELEEFRREYMMDGLRRNTLCDSPFAQFEQWMDQAIRSQIADPTAMTLATVDADGQPSQRIVLLKHFDEKGCVFYTNFGSAKAQDISGNPKVSVHFPWHMLERQVKIIGRARKLDTATSIKYFLSRPRDSQLAALASKQSRKISSRTFLEAQFQSMKAKYAQGDLPLPDFWGGFIIEPSGFEFWQGGENRLHDRFQYRKSGDAWVIERLAP